MKEARYADILSLIRIHRRCSPEIYIGLKNVQMRRIVSWDILENLRFCFCFCKTLLHVTTSYSELEKAQKRQWLSLPWRDYDSTRSVLRLNFSKLSLKQFDVAHFETWLKQATNLLQKWTLLPEVIYFMLAFIISPFSACGFAPSIF